MVLFKSCRKARSCNRLAEKSVFLGCWAESLQEE